MKILSIETSCDETSAAVVEKTDDQNVKIFANITATSLALHATTGGIIPENASREQLKFIIPVITNALLKSEDIENKSPKEDVLIASKILKEKIDAIAVTHGPGLIGSLLVGVETAKTLSFSLRKPLIPVHHLLAHLFANFISNEKKIEFPFIGLIVSGGHTDLLLFKTLTDFEWLGGTRDDACGEALDKIGRILNLSYPAGPEIESRANRITKTNIRFKSPMINSEDFDFSFSGLKAEAARFIESQNLTDELINEICFALQRAIFDVLIKKTIKAAEKYNVQTILLGGGVSANQTLANQFRNNTKLNIFTPEKKYSTDNAAMIGAYAALNPETIDWHDITANPELYFD